MSDFRQFARSASKGARGAALDKMPVVLLVEDEMLVRMLAAEVLSGLAPPPLADESAVGYRPASHEGGGRRCGAWTVARRRSRSDPSAPPKAIAGSAAARAASSSTSAPAPC